MRPRPSALLANLLQFGRLLHSLGVDIQAGRMVDVAGALTHVEIGRQADFYFTLRSLLIHRREDLAVFDDAFHVFWLRPHGEWSPGDLRATGEQRRLAPPEVEAAGTDLDSPGASSPSRTETIERIAAMSYSRREASRIKDFAELTDAELAEAKTMIAALTWDVGTRRTRRWVVGRGRKLDVRRLVRRTVQYGGEALELPRRERRVKKRPLVLLCDVSGSMERYARMLLHFVHSLAGGLTRVEAFVFATRLTRITRELRRRDGQRSVPNIPRQIPDWAGGTRIGDALRAFNLRWARRVMAHGPVVLLISDGWDRGEPAQLQAEMHRLQRTCHRLIWLNPLLGSPEYQPLTRGMQAALPFVDDFLPVHNLASLEALAEHLNQLPKRRGARGGGHAGRSKDRPLPT